MKRLLLLVALVLLAAPSLGSAAKSNEKFLVADHSKSSEWWAFGNLNLSVVGRPSKGKSSLAIKGSTPDWYVGGIGIYLANPENDFSGYSGLEMDVFGTGAKSGTLKIELYDDDNGNWLIEQDKKTFEPLFDDKFVHELKITWDGRKHVLIPFSEFVDINQNVGDNIWNPNLSGRSGGLLQMQYIAVASSKIGTVDFILDNIGFYGANKKL